MSQNPASNDARERRRQKILARSEERLKKLTNSTWKDSGESDFAELSDI